jgi:amino acid transporter
LISCVIILLTGGFVVFTKGNWDPASFVSSYLYVFFIFSHHDSANNQRSDIPLVLLAYGGYKLIRRTEIISLSQVPVQLAIDEANDDPDNVPIKKDSVWAKMNILWG